MSKVRSCSQNKPFVSYFVCPIPCSYLIELEDFSHVIPHPLACPAVTVIDITEVQLMAELVLELIKHLVKDIVSPVSSVAALRHLKIGILGTFQTSTRFGIYIICMLYLSEPTILKSESRKLWYTRRGPLQCSGLVLFLPVLLPFSNHTLGQPL